MAMFQKHTFDQTRQDIFKWLAAPDPFVNHVLNRKKRPGSTGTWLLTSKQYDTWLHGRKSLLWLYGIPGCGKTVLCSTIVEQLIRYSQQDASIGLAYFYFDFNDPQKQDTGSLTRCIITQLASQCPTIPGSLVELHEMRQKGRNVFNEEMLLSTLRSIILLFNNVYLVFDALDESSNYDEALQFIYRLNSWGIPQLHLLATSRQITSIEDSLLPSSQMPSAFIMSKSTKTSMPTLAINLSMIQILSNGLWIFASKLQSSLSKARQECSNGLYVNWTCYNDACR